MQIHRNTRISLVTAVCSGRGHVLLEIITDLDRNFSAGGELDDGSTFECDNDTFALRLHPNAAAGAEVHHREMARAAVDL